MRAKISRKSKKIKEAMNAILMMNIQLIPQLANKISIYYHLKISQILVINMLKLPNHSIEIPQISPHFNLVNKLKHTNIIVQI